MEDKLEELSVPCDIIDPTSEYIAVLGDVQTLTHYDLSYFFVQSFYWIKQQNKTFSNFRALLQVGDVSERNDPSEWRRYQNKMLMLDGIMPVITVSGNHDYDWDHHEVITSRESCLLNDYVSNSLLEKNIVERFDEVGLENVIVEIEIHGSRYYVLALEFAPRREVLEWADSVVSADATRRYFLMTHEFLIYDGIVNTLESYARRHFPDGNGCSPEEIWDVLIYDNDNIICVLCGHNGYSLQFYAPNASGRDVPLILYNLQYQPLGGESELQLWEFPAEGDSVHVFAYNPHFGQLVDKPNTQFSFRYK